MAADNPHVINGAFEIPEDLIVYLEPGVVIQMQPGSTLTVAGGLEGLGTLGSPIQITGSVSNGLRVSGELTLEHADLACRVTPLDGGSLSFSATSFSGAADLTTFTSEVVCGGVAVDHHPRSGAKIDVAIRQDGDLAAPSLSA